MVLSALVNILYIPIALNYWGVEKYGVWILLQTMVNFFGIASFGVPTSVTNLLCQTDNFSEKRDILFKGVKVLGVVSLLLIFSILVVYFTVLYTTPWLNNYSYEIRLSGLLLILFFVLRIPLHLAGSIYISEHKIYILKIFDLLTTVLSFFALLIVIYFKQNLLFLSVLSGLLLFVLSAINFFTALKQITAEKTDQPFNKIRSKTVYTSGLKLFVAGMGSIIVWNTDNVVISKFLGFQEVAIYSTAFKLFSVAYLSFTLLNVLITPYYGKLYSQDETEKLKRLFNFNMVIIPFIGLCIWLVVWLFSQEIILLWLGNSRLYGGGDLYFILGAYGLILAHVGVMSHLLTTLNLLKYLVYLTFSEAFVNLLLSIYFVQIIGAEGVALGTLIGVVFVPLLWLPILIHRNKKLKFSFPFYKTILSLVFYTSILLILFLLNADQIHFYYKILLSVSLISLILYFQFVSHRKPLTDILKQLKTDNHNGI